MKVYRSSTNNPTSDCNAQRSITITMVFTQKTLNSRCIRQILIALFWIRVFSTAGNLYNNKSARYNNLQRPIHRGEIYVDGGSFWAIIYIALGIFVESWTTRHLNENLWNNITAGSSLPSARTHYVSRVERNSARRVVFRNAFIHIPKGKTRGLAL